MIKFLRKRKNDSAFGRNFREKTFLNFRDIQHVMIIFDIADLDEACDVIDLLQKDGKTVSAWTIRPKDKAVASGVCPPQIRVIDAAKELTWSQTLSKGVIEEYHKVSYDTFLDLTTADNDILDYLLASNSSRFCIGIREREIPVYDFIMLKQGDDSFSDVYNQLKHYLQHIIA